MNASSQLEQFYTDIWLRCGRSVLRQLRSPLAGLGDRFHAEIPGRRVRSFNLGGMAQVASFRRTRTVEAAYQSFIRTGQWFCRNVNRQLAKRKLRSEACAAFLFNTGALETIPLLHAQGIRCVVDQIDPARVEEQVVLEECEKWPGWQKMPGRIPEAYYERLAGEWTSADAVMVNSKWTQTALIRQGVAAEKIRVVPLAYEPARSDWVEPRTCQERRSDQSFVVLWIGQVILRKGIPYLFEAARELLGENVRFIVAGWIGISDVGVKSAPANVKLIGPVTRSQTAELYQSADLFVLSTLSDGFAMTQLEAMSAGLPVIATDRCGEVVTDQVDGVIIPPADPKALAAAIYSLLVDRDRRDSFAQAARTKSAGFTLRRFAEGINQSLPI